MALRYGQIQKKRKIGGHWYTFSESTTSKAEAQKMAARWRRTTDVRGLSVRILYRQGYYLLYVRKF